MKIFLNIFLLLFISGLWGISCKRLIQVPKVPGNIEYLDDPFADSIAVLGPLAAIYMYQGVLPENNDFFELNILGFGFQNGLMGVACCLSADELTCYNPSDKVLDQFYKNNLYADNRYVSFLWNSLYSKINLINSILEGLDKSNRLSVEFVNRIKSEIKTVRALYYFYLVNLFGDIPFISTTVIKDNIRIPRLPEKKVYEQLEHDLTVSVNTLESKYPSEGRARPNLFTALALRSKLYLSMERWQGAFHDADVIIKVGGYELETDLDAVFLLNSKEAIWQLPFGSSKVVAADAFFFIPNINQNVYQFNLTTQLLSAFESKDRRRENWIRKMGKEDFDKGGVRSDDIYYPYKYKKTSSVDNHPEEAYMIFRLAEIYLIRAEAAAHLGNTVQALHDLNIIRRRAGLDELALSDKEDLLDAIMQERRIELFSEWGNRWFDLKRTGKASEVLSKIKPGWTDDAALYPIPKNELLLDDLLKPNPGY